MSLIVLSHELFCSLVAWGYEDNRVFVLRYYHSSFNEYEAAKTTDSLVDRLEAIRELLENRQFPLVWQDRYEELLEEYREVIHFFRQGAHDAGKEWEQGEEDVDEKFEAAKKVVKRFYSSERECFWYLSGFYENYSTLSKKKARSYDFS